MKLITKDQISKAVSNASKEINNNIMEDINNMFIQMKNNTGVDPKDPNAQITMIVALIQGKTNEMLERVLTELLCE